MIVDSVNQNVEGQVNQVTYKFTKPFRTQCVWCGGQTRPQDRQATVTQTTLRKYADPQRQLKAKRFKRSLKENKHRSLFCHQQTLIASFTGEND